MATAEEIALGARIRALTPFTSTGAAPTGGSLVLVAGTKTVATTAVTANSLVLFGRKTAGGTLGNLTYTINPGVSFTVTSDNALDTSTVSWIIVEQG